MNLLEKNLEKLQEYKIKLYDKVIQIIEKKQYDFSKFKTIGTKNGQKTIEIQYGEKKIRLNSLYNPELEAKCYAKKYNFNNLDVPLLMFGMGNGIFTREMLYNLQKDSVAILYEPDLSLFIFCLFNFYLGDIISDDRVIILVEGINSEYVSEVLRCTISSKMLYTQIVCSHPKFEELYGEQSKKFVSAIRERFCQCDSDLITYISFEGREVENAIKNIHLIKDSNLVSDLVGKIPEDVPFIIVAAGPSLDKNVDELKSAYGKSIIAVLDTSVRTVLNHDIKFDVIVSVDAEKPVEYLKDSRCLNYPMFATFTANNEILELNKGKKLWLVNTSQFLYSLCEDHNIDMKIETMGGSVATAAFSIAKMLGLKKIIFVGQDLAYSGEFTHAGGVIDEAERDSINFKWNGYVEGIDGNQVKIRKDWYNFLKWFEKNIKLLEHDIEVIDATEGGAKIHGTKIMKLSEAIDKYCVKRFDFREIINGLLPMFNDNEYMSVRQDLLHLEYEIGIIEEVVVKGIDASNKMFKILKKDELDEEYEKEYITLIKNSNDIIEKQFVYTLVSSYIKKDVDFIMRTVNQVEEDRNKNFQDICTMTKYMYEKIKEAVNIIRPQLHEELKKI